MEVALPVKQPYLLYWRAKPEIIFPVPGNIMLLLRLLEFAHEVMRKSLLREYVSTQVPVVTCGCYFKAFLSLASGTLKVGADIFLR
jgi:hypothetical protein